MADGGGGFKAGWGLARLGVVGQHRPGSGGAGRAAHTSRARERSGERGPIRGGEKYDRWARPKSGPRLSVKEREREKSMTGVPRVNQIKFELFQTYSNLTCSKQDLPEVENFEINYG
jgi:hypothetical protein